MYLINTTDPQERLRELIEIRDDLNNTLSVLLLWTSAIVVLFF